MRGFAQAGLLLALFFAISPPTPAAAFHAQADGQEPAVEETDLDKYLRLSRSGSPVVRPQAAQRLVSLGAPAVERVTELCKAGDVGLAELGTDLTEVLADFDDPWLRAHLWTALEDPDFPWRPAAARGLARAPRSGDAQRFLVTLEDPIATVREPSVRALELLDERSAKELLRAHLSDPDDRVRRAVAQLLFRWGDHCTVTWLVEDLKRDDRWFELQTGKLARYQSLKALEQGLDGHLRRNFGFKATKTWDDPANAEAVKKIEAFAAKACPDPPELPPVARASAPTEGDVLGFEIRSCRKGEFFLRWNESDVLFVGTGNAVRIELAEGTVARLLAAAKESLGKLGDQRLWGQPGCDTEQLVFRPESDARSTSYRVSKGQKSLEGLRPEGIAALETLLLETLPDGDADDERIANLRSRVLDALAVVGGPLSAQ